MEYYRGTTPGEKRRIRFGDDWWDSQFFVTDDPRIASAYGERVERIEIDPSARILREGTREFVRVAGKWRKGESLFDFALRAAHSAQEAGYDGIHFARQGDVGTIIFNLSAITRRDPLNPERKSAMYTEFQAEGKTFRPVRFNPPLGDYTRRVISGSDVYPPAQMAQIFVGLNVGPRKMITAEEIRDYIMQIRDKQLGSGVQHGGSVTPLLGWWRSTDEPWGHGLEDSVMVEILNIGTETEAKFKHNMQTIASRVARHFRQDAVVIRFWDEGQVSSSSLFYTEAKASNPRRSPFPAKYATQQERIYPEGAELDPARHKALGEVLSRAITLAKRNGYDMDYTEGKMYVASAMQHDKDPLDRTTLEWYFDL